MAKFLITCFVCGVIGFTAGIPLKDDSYQEPSMANKTSTEDATSVFGIKPIQASIQNPILNIRQTSAVVARNEKVNKNKMTEALGDKHNKRALRKETIALSSVLNENLNKTTKNVNLDILYINSSTNKQNVQVKTRNLNEKENTDLQTDRNKHTSNKDKDIKIDKTYIDDLFNDARDSNTMEDHTISEYETTTTDEDIDRIPPEVLASLVG